MVDKKNQVLIPIQYSSIKSLNYKDKFLVTKDYKKGLLHIDNAFLVAMDYEELEWNDQRKVFFARKNGKDGVISEKEEIVVPFEYDDLEDTWEGAYVVQVADKYGVISYAQEEIIPIRYPSIYDLRLLKDYTKVAYHVCDENKKSAFFDTSGKQKTDFVFEEYEIHGRYKPVKVTIGATTFYVNGYGVCIKECPSASFLEQHGLQQE